MHVFWRQSLTVSWQNRQCSPSKRQLYKWEVVLKGDEGLAARTRGRRMNDRLSLGYPSDTHIEEAADDDAEDEGYQRRK